MGAKAVRRDENRLFARAFLQFEFEPILLHLEDRQVVLLHQVDDGFDVFEFQGVPFPGEAGRLGKAVFAARSSRAFAGSAREVILAIIENPLELRADEEAVEQSAERAQRRNVSDEIVHFGPPSGLARKRCS